MRFQHVLQRVYGEPWMITKPGWYAIHQLVAAHVGKAAEVTERFKVEGPEGKRPEKGFFGPVQQFRVQDGVAIIPVKGAIVKGASLFEKSCGACAPEDIHEDLDEVERRGIKSVILDFNSPGGMVMGTPEVASRIAGLKKSGVKVTAYTEELMCSAAFYMAAGASQILATPSAIVGSIGVIWEFENMVGWLEAQGIRYEVFTSGKFKGMGHPGKELTDDQRTWIQEHVDATAEQFKDHVRNHRRGVKESAMEGQILTGDEGKSAKLVDDVVTGFKEALELARA